MRRRDPSKIGAERPPVNREGGGSISQSGGGRGEFRNI